MFIPDHLRSNAVWRWHGALAFTPDGGELYMDIYVDVNNEGIQTRFMEMIDNVWTDPQTPSFAESYDTASPSLTNNGNTVHFLSDRPGGFVWTSTRTQGGWSTPTVVQFPWPSNLGPGWEVSATHDGTLYLRMEVIGSQDPDIYCVRCVNGVYAAPERLGDHINSSSMELAPYIDPDEDYLIFVSWRPGGYGWSDLYISFRQPDGSWTPAENMGEAVNSSAGDGAPFASADGHYLFFNSDRHQQWDTNPYWVSAQVIEDLRGGTAVGDSPSSGPQHFDLHQNYPNPFNPSTTIHYDIIQPSNVKLEVFNVRGEWVRTLLDDHRAPAGSFQIEWDGIDADGLAAGSGTYLVRLTSENVTQIRKMVLIR